MLILPLSFCCRASFFHNHLLHPSVPSHGFLPCHHRHTRRQLPNDFARGPTHQCKRWQNRIGGKHCPWQQFTTVLDDATGRDDTILTDIDVRAQVGRLDDRVFADVGHVANGQRNVGGDPFADGAAGTEDTASVEEAIVTHTDRGQVAADGDGFLDDALFVVVVVFSVCVRVGGRSVRCGVVGSVM